ncbi:MAG: beta-phosphoglucomutase family hydrolase [Mucilaginibacter sp.]|uniref:HAD family hydrolase n=1 Tax=Mucilaginibacter sp. TaxID=1882438 RepID=UPI0026212DAF|nr:HAD family phosphatase [Mucilaginibacter sp.]MDB5003365.1 beta-phosphoglucomutase family hydrolase [Mucilaginibacter sp.]
MKNIAAIFDMDGTMVNNTPYHLKSWQTLFKKYGLSDLQPQTYYTKISGIPIIDTLKSLFANADEATLRSLLKEKEGLYREFYAPYIAPINGLENLLIELKEAGFKLAIASSATMDDIDFVLNHVPVRQYFDVIIDGNRVSKGKPNPQIFLKAAADLNILPQDCVVFEDSLAGIKAANAAQMKVVGITTGQTADKLQPSNLVITDFTELTVEKLEALF